MIKITGFPAQYIMEDLELELDFNEFADLLLGVLDAELENFIGAGDHIEKIIINDPVTVLLTEKGRKVVVKD